jgi:hypothetical protein
MQKNILVVLAVIVLASVAFAASTSNGEIEKQAAIQNDDDSQNRCFNTEGRFESRILAPELCSSGFCTEGKLIGSLSGDYNFTANKFVPADESSIPNVMFYTGFSRVFTHNGELDLTDAGAIDMSTGSLSSLLTVTGGTGDYVKAAGYLHIFGATDMQSGTTAGKFEGRICK